MLVLLLDQETKFLAQWQRPYEIIHQAGPVDNEAHQPNRQKPKQVYHINMLKLWQVQEALWMALYQEEPEMGPSPGDKKGEKMLS